MKDSDTPSPAAPAPAADPEAARMRQNYPNSPELWGGPARVRGVAGKVGAQATAPAAAPTSPAPASSPAAAPSPTAAPPAATPAPAAAPAASPALRLPPGVDANSPELADFGKATQGLDAGARQALLDWHFSTGDTAAAKLQETLQAATKADPEIGGAQLKAAIADSGELFSEFGNASLRELVAGPMGDHPEVIRFLTKVSRALRQARGRR